MSSQQNNEQRSEPRKVPQEQIDRANADIVAVIGKYIPLKKTGKNWSACCPFHQEKSPSFSVSEAKEMFYCFGCGASGDAVSFVQQHTGCSFREAVESINGRLELSTCGYQASAPPVRAVRCSLPGHAESPEKALRATERAESVRQHAYLLRNNTSPCGDVLQLNGSLIVPLFNNLGEQVNAAAITSDGIRYAAGKPSFGSTAVLEPSAASDGITIICADYAYAWRIWWKQGGRSRVLCTMEPENLSWMLANCKDRFTHVACDPLETEWYADEGHHIFPFPIDPYERKQKISA